MRTKLRILPYIATATVITLLLCPSLESFVSFLGRTVLICWFSWQASTWIAKLVLVPQLPQVSRKGKAVFVTGCDSGFGHLTALSLNATGFTVFAGCYDPNGEGASRLKKHVSDSSRLHIIPLDVTKDESVSNALKSVESILHQSELKLFGVVNNAGILRVGQFEWGSLDYMVRDVMEVNTMGVARVTRSFLPLIRESQGRIVNINSTASRYSVPTLVSYCMAKHASMALTEGLRREMKKFALHMDDDSSTS